ncbi:conjugative transposon protein TraM [Carboxylicivirga mesophila]|uniref:Conjugative transposon protein TraM n=1 Tax=Carboxylicivirga mesophila TaxID=1166478 RepID=A0ABS5K6U6_9BACT|nr:conjugative transposon protein TraM [Carboxylicivirga mesophila]MBS2210714.1 conjugative transposon protein TraM [Carboxylicivirga mesophila]
MKKQIKQHKALFILPLALLPFIVLIFYILGGGSPVSDTSQSASSSGANYQLPDANRDIAIMDKQEAYRQLGEETVVKPVQLDIDTTMVLNPLELTENMPEEQINEVLLAHVKKQEAQSREALQGQNHLMPQSPTTRRDNTNAEPVTKESDTYRTYTGSPKARRSSYISNDMEQQTLTQLLEEHERLLRQNDSLNHQLQKATANKQAVEIQARLDVQINTNSGFEPVTQSRQGIKALVVEDTKVLSGNRVMLQLMNDAVIGDKTIRKGTLIYGLCKTENERLQLVITSVPYRDAFLPVKLSAYDLDGIRGLYVPDNVQRKAYKDVAGDVNPSVLLSPSDHPLSYLGVSAAADLSKTMVKRVRLKRVYLRKNTVLILKNDKSLKN